LIKKTLNFLALNIILASATSFILNYASFEEDKKGISLTQGRLGTLKLPDKNFTVFVEGSGLRSIHPMGTHFN